jgi:hypothetical protein
MGYAGDPPRWLFGTVVQAHGADGNAAKDALSRSQLESPFSSDPSGENLLFGAAVAPRPAQSDTIVSSSLRSILPWAFRGISSRIPRLSGTL